MNLQINYIDTDIKMMPLQIRDELHIKKGYYFKYSIPMLHIINKIFYYKIPLQ